MTADWARLPHDLLGAISSRIVNEVQRHQPRRLRHQLEAAVDDRVGVTSRWRARVAEYASMTRLRPPPPAHRVLAARRRLPHRRAARRGGRAEDAGDGRSPSTATCSRRSSSTTRRASAASIRSSAARSTSRRAIGATKSGTPGETANHLVLLAETNEGYHNLIKLVSSGYTEGFYYKPRIDKELLAQHAKGLIGLSSCLKGEVATGIRTEQQQKAVAAAAPYRDILGTSNFFLEMQYQGIDEQRIVNIGLLPIASDLEHAARRHQRRPLPAATATTSRTTSCCASAPARSVNDTRAPEVSRRPVLPEDRRGDGGRSSATTRTRCRTRCGSPSAATSTCPFKENHLPNFDVPAGFTLDDYFEHVVRAGLRRCACRACASSTADGRAEAHARRVRAAARLRNRR